MRNLHTLTIKSSSSSGSLDTRFLGKTHLGREGGVRFPFCRCAWSRLFHHLVHLFQGETLGLRDQEVGVDEGAGAEGAPDEEDFRAEIAPVGVDHVWGYDGDYLVLVLAGWVGWVGY